MTTNVHERKEAWPSLAVSRGLSALGRRTATNRMAPDHVQRFGHIFGHQPLPPWSLEHRRLRITGLVKPYLASRSGAFRRPERHYECVALPAELLGPDCSDQARQPDDSSASRRPADSDNMDNNRERCSACERPFQVCRCPRVRKSRPDSARRRSGPIVPGDLSCWLTLP
jgi:hypothetical protein